MYQGRKKKVSLHGEARQSEVQVQAAPSPHVLRAPQHKAAWLFTTETCCGASAQKKGEGSRGLGPGSGSQVDLWGQWAGWEAQPLGESSSPLPRSPHLLPPI